MMSPNLILGVHTQQKKSDSLLIIVLFLFMHMGEKRETEMVCVPQVCAVPKVSRRGLCISWNRSYRWLWATCCWYWQLNLYPVTYFANLKHFVPFIFYLKENYASCIKILVLTLKRSWSSYYVFKILPNFSHSATSSAIILLF